MAGGYLAPVYPGPAINPQARKPAVRVDVQTHMGPGLVRGNGTKPVVVAGQFGSRYQRNPLAVAIRRGGRAVTGFQ